MNYKTLYYAVNGSGQGAVFTSSPLRDDHMKIWAGEIEGLYCQLVMQLEAEELISLPVMTWSDEPVKLELNLVVEKSHEDK